MLKQKNVMKSLSIAALALAATACGSKVGGTYTLSSVGQNSAISNACQGVQLIVTSSSNAVSATGSGGTGCTETLQGTESNGTIVVSSYTISIPTYNLTCTYNSGTITVNNNVMSGSVTSTNLYQTNSNCGTSLTINGTKTN